MVSKASAAKRKSNTSKPATATPPAKAVPASPSSHSQEDQQRLLDIFSDAFANVLASERFPVLLQQVKQDLFNRDFGAAFGSEENLEAYAARWSPTRALCYASIFKSIKEYVDQVVVTVHDPETESKDNHALPYDDAIGGQQAETTTPVEDLRTDETRADLKSQSHRLPILCIGGCAAEHVAVASYLRETHLRGNLTMLDSAPWAHVTSILQNKLITDPPLSKYASTAAKASNKPLIGKSQLSTTFRQADVLSVTREELARLLGAQDEPVVVTLLFTLNELYTDGGIGKTTKFLRSLGEILPSRSLLLVVDSPGSYSEAAVGKEKKKYPMQWLLNHTLLEGKHDGFSWERLKSEDSVWFRLPDGLNYPIQLENMRYQIHLYRIDRE